MDQDPALHKTVPDPVPTGLLTPPDLSVLDDPFALRESEENAEEQSRTTAEPRRPEPRRAEPTVLEGVSGNPSVSIMLAMAASLAMLSGLVAVTSSAIPQAIASVILTGSSSLLTFLICQRSFQQTIVVPAPMVEARPDSAARQTTFNEMEQIRFFFKDLHDDIRDKDDEIERLQELLDDKCRTASSIAFESHLPSEESEIQPPTHGELQRIESGVWEATRSAVPVREATRTVVERRRSEARSRGIKLTSRVAARIGDAETNPEAFERIVTTLLDHALERTPSYGHVTVSTSMRPNKGDDTQRLCIRIKDNGPHIPGSEQRSLFEADDQSPSRLGLAIARAYSMALGGTLRLESGAENGCTVIAELPMTPVEDVNDTNAPSAESTDDQGNADAETDRETSSVE